MPSVFLTDTTLLFCLRVLPPERDCFKWPSLSCPGSTFSFKLFVVKYNRHQETILCVTKAHIRRRQWHPTPVLLPGKSHGRRSLVGCSPWGRYESDTTERLHFDFSLSCIGEGNGNPLQCSYLENPRDGRACLGCHLWGRTESDTTEAT